MKPIPLRSLMLLALAAGTAHADHPRLLVQSAPDTLRTRINAQPEAAKQLDAIKARVQPYVDRHGTDPAWITSRLQMYWQSHATQVYVKNGVYDHADGKAPVPTVRFTGTRDAVSQYMTPKLEDVKPYMGERDLLWLQNKAADGQPWEWVSQAKSGRVVESLNLRIAELARDAAFLYWYSGDESYARFAYDIFDVYMSGIAYRSVPIDLNRGHDQTLLGLQSFEVIHEDIVGPLTETYDFMHGYIRQRAGEKRSLFDTAFKKWADLIISNGVPWNNWNLIEARFVLHIAAILAPDSSYTDGRGSDYYVRSVLEDRAARQWSLRRLMQHGYDASTGIWNESPGYAINVAGDFMETVDLLDLSFGIDALPQLSVLPLAARALPQYLLPNGRTVGFGDSRYELPRIAMIERLLAHAERHGRVADRDSYAALLAALRSGGAEVPKDRLHALLGQLQVKPAPVSGATAAAWQTPTFHAPNASWLVQRSGYQGANARDNAMVISQAGSSGNHAHANGIAMELYAQGLSLAPEGGRGSGYLQNDHLEYYSQFPSHNTVVVDGLSAYPSMKSNHPFALQAMYPASGSPAAEAFPWASFSDVSFIEPETNADQARVLGIVRLDDGNGYFVDIFRSRRRDGKDRYHDYIYHNLGQSMQFIGSDGAALPAAPSERLSFADGDLVGYDYWQDRQSLTSRKPLRARFKLQLPQRAVTMTAWLQGSSEREYFSVMAPPSTAWQDGMLPRELARAPLPTLVVRQHGEAWRLPFTAIFEANGERPAQVQKVEQIIDGTAVALLVSTAGQRQQTIISGDADNASFQRNGQMLQGRYAIIAQRQAKLDYLFLGHGRQLASAAYMISATAAPAAAALWQQDGDWRYAASQPTSLQVPAADWPATLTLKTDKGQITIAAQAALHGGVKVWIYQLPAMAATRLRKNS